MALSSWRLIGIAALGAGVGVTSAQAQIAPGWTITPVVNSGTSLPGTDELFSAIDQYSVTTDGTRVAFSLRAGGVYEWSGGAIRALADVSTPIPGFKGLLSQFGPPYIDGPNVYFIAAGIADTVLRPGVYRAGESGIEVVADTRTPAPGGAGAFQAFVGQHGWPHYVEYLVAQNGNVAFPAEEPDRNGMYIAHANGEITTVVDSTMPYPGLPPTSRVRQFWWPSIDGDDVAFVSFTPQGTYARIDGSLYRFAASAAPAPGGGTFGGLIGTPEIHDGRVLFLAMANGLRGIFRGSSQGVELALNTNSAFPGEPGPVSDLLGFSFDRGRIAVTVAGVHGSTLFAEVNGALRRVLDSSAALDGKDIDEIYVETTAFDHRTLVVTVTFTDKTLGVYMLRPTCLSDWNLDGAVSSQDFFDFLAGFFSDNADFNEDDDTTSQDFFDYLAVFFSGC